MAGIDDLAEIALSGNALLLRSAVQDWLRENPRLSVISLPVTRDPTLLAVAASFVEMFAERAGQIAPDWTRHVRPAPQPLFLVREARTMKRLHKLCKEQSPLPLRRRQIFAPPNYLEFA